MDRLLLVKFLNGPIQRNSSLKFSMIKDAFNFFSQILEAILVFLNFLIAINSL